MKPLIIILSIIAFFIILLSVKLSVIVHSDEGMTLDVQWLFVKLHILPAKEKKKKKKKKEKKKKEEKPQEEKPKDETVHEPKPKKENIITRYYHNQGIPGFIELLSGVCSSLGGMFGRIFKAFIIDELLISMRVGTDDSAKTAIKYGKICSAVFPALGVISTKMRLRKHNCEIIPDFIYGENSLKFHVKLSIVPRRLIGAVLILPFELLFKVVIKLLSGSRKKKSKAKKAEI